MLVVVIRRRLMLRGGNIVALATWRDSLLINRMLGCLRLVLSLLFWEGVLIRDRRS